MTQTTARLGVMSGRQGVGGPLIDTLGGVARRRQQVTAQTRVLQGAWVLGLVLLAVLLLDANVDLPTWARVAVLGGVVIWAASRAAAWAWGRRYGRSDVAMQLRLACDLERALALPHNRLVNALLLDGDATACDDALTRELAHRSTMQGVAAVRELDVTAAVDREPVRRETARLWAVGVAWLVVTMIQPGVVGQGMMRVALPWSAMPAFSLTRLDVVVEPAQPVAGDDVRVTVRMGGLMPDDAPTLAEHSQVGQTTRNWPMRVAGDNVWRHMFYDLHEPVQFTIRAGGATTQLMVVAPATEAESAGGLVSKNNELPHNTSVRDARTEATDASDAVEGRMADGAHADTHVGGSGGDMDTVAMIETWHALMLQAAAIRDLASALAGANEVDELTRLAMHEALRNEIETFATNAAALADQLTTHAAELDQPMRGEVLALASLLRGLALSDFMSSTDMADVADTLAPAGLRDAAEADRATLATRGPGMSDLLESGGGQVHINDDAPSRLRIWDESAKDGVYHVTMGEGDPQQVARMQAIVEQAPPAYRTLVERYFRTLAEEASQ